MKIYDKGIQKMFLSNQLKKHIIIIQFRIIITFYRCINSYYHIIFELKFYVKSCTIFAILYV